MSGNADRGGGARNELYIMTTEIGRGAGPRPADRPAVVRPCIMVHFNSESGNGAGTAQIRSRFAKGRESSEVDDLM